MDVAEQAVAVNAAVSWLRQTPGWLLVLDNADDVHVVHKHLPAGPYGGCILLTRRGPISRTLAAGIEIDTLSVDDGARFLLRRAARLDEGVELTDASAEDRAAALTLSHDVGGLPLALDKAGAYIEETETTPARYAALYRDDRARMLAARGGVADATGHPDSVAVTFQIAFKSLTGSSPAAADLIRMSAFLAPDSIPEEIFTGHSEELPETLASAAADEVLWDETIKAARRLALLRRDGEERTLSLHRLVHAVIRDDMDLTARRSWAERVVRCVEAAFPTGEHGTWPECERLMAHASICVEQINTYGIESIDAACLLSNVDNYLYARGEYARARPYSERALAIWEKALGPEHPSTATSLNNLAGLYQSQGDYTAALPIYERALAIREKALGPEHPHTTASLNNLASLYRSQGDYAAALPLYERALGKTEEASDLRARAAAIRAAHAEANRVE
jgi:tetratricopeptide (TPR) repeat protein